MRDGKVLVLRHRWSMSAAARNGNTANNSRFVILVSWAAATAAATISPLPTDGAFRKKTKRTVHEKKEKVAGMSSVVHSECARRSGEVAASHVARTPCAAPKVLRIASQIAISKRPPKTALGSLAQKRDGMVP